MKSSSPRSAELSLMLGSRIDAIAGLECNVYFEALSLKTLSEDWELSVICEIGRQMGDRWTLIAEPSQIGKHAFSISYRGPVDGELISASCELHIHDPASLGRTYRWLPIGDSITGAGGYVEALATHPLLANGALTTLGTRSLNAAPAIRHEGYPGWKYVDFIKQRSAPSTPNFREETQSPFLLSANGDQCDFGKYVEVHLGHQEPDFITIFLGANDVALLNDETLEDGISSCIQHAETLVHEILRATSHSILGIVPPLHPSSQDAFGINYGCLIPRWRYRKNQHALARALQSKFLQFHPRVSVIPAHFQIDSRSGYPSQVEPVHAKAEETHVINTNSVHPSPSGHRQISDALLAWIAGR